jgi:hypothetical protein
VSAVSPLRRKEIIDALRIGAVPRRGLEHLAVGLDRFEAAVAEELDMVAAGRGKFKAVRGEYGSGKTFFARWLEHRARESGFATTLVQISETDTPLYRMETVYRRALEALQTKEWSDGAFRALVDRWFYNLEDEVLASGKIDGNDREGVARAVGELLEQRLAMVSATQPQFAAALRAFHTARALDDHALAEGLIGWLMGQPNVGASIKRAAGLKGDLDHRGAAGFLRGLLELLRQTGRKGLVLVLDEVETIQRVRADSREKSLNALRQLSEELSDGRYPGLYVLITGTPKFFDGPQGIKRSEALAQRLHTNFSKDPRFDNSRAAQIRLMPFDMSRLLEVGHIVRDLYVSAHAPRIACKIDDSFLTDLASHVTGTLGGKVGIAPRIFLRRLVDELDKVDEHADYDPREYVGDPIATEDMTDEERAAAGRAVSVDDIHLDIE